MEEHNPVILTTGMSLTLLYILQSHGKREKMERDPAAPKRPSNAFLHFCQEQRDAIAAAPHPPSSPSSSTTTTAGRPLDKKQLTRLLATRWNALTEDDKKVCTNH